MIDEKCTGKGVFRMEDYTSPESVAAKADFHYRQLSSNQSKSKSPVQNQYQEAKTRFKTPSKK